MTQIDQAVNNQSQTDQIVDYMLAGNKITAIIALDLFKCFRLAARIADAKKRGYDIMTTFEITENGKRYAVYSIPENRKENPNA